MKLIDKFALIPIDQYNQLVQQGLLPKEDTNIAKQEGAGGTVEESKKHRSLALKQQDPLNTAKSRHNNIVDSIDDGDNGELTITTDRKTQKNTIQDQTKSEKSHKIPPPPPGTPNKTPKSYIRWIRLF